MSNEWWKLSDKLWVTIFFKPNKPQVSVWIGIMCFAFCFFFFFNAFQLLETNFTISALLFIVYALFTESTITLFKKNIKNKSHDIIYIFKNYFITIFLVFNFQQNKPYLLDVSWCCPFTCWVVQYFSSLFFFFDCVSMCSEFIKSGHRRSSSNWVLTSPKRKAEKYVGPNGRKSIWPYINGLFGC